MPTASANGITLTYETQGDPCETPLLLIMGLGMQLVSWPQAFVDGLVAQGFYVIRFDNRDSGLSTKMERFGTPNLPFAYVKTLFRLPLKSGYTLDDMAADSVGLLDVLGLARAHIVGISMGGMIAQIVAARYPERILSLTSLMSSSGRRGLPGPSVAARKAMLSRPKNPCDPQQVLAQMIRTFKIIGSPAYPATDAEMQAILGGGVKRSLYMAGSARQIVAIVASKDRLALLKKIHCPTLVLHGAQDPLVPLACGRDTARWIPNAVLRIIDGMGHDLPSALHPHLIDMIAAHCKGRAVPETDFVPARSWLFAKKVAS
ncbi:MAG: alpha/beta hydrolase [Pseudomonadota bacterium]